MEGFMKYVRSNLLFAALLALLLATSLPSAPAVADDDQWVPWNTSTDNDGETTTIFYNKEAPNWLFHFVSVEKDGTTWEYDYVLGGSNPNPDDSKGIEPVNVPGLIKSGRITYKVFVNPESSPLGKFITPSGGGFGPHSNPGGEDGGKGHGTVPVHSNEGPKKSLKEIASLIQAQNRIAKALIILETSMGGEEGSGESKPTPNKKGGKKGGKVSDKGDNKPKHLGETESLGPKPEVVNPPPKSRVSTAAKCAPNMTLNASGKGCVPKLDLGEGGSLGSTMGTSIGPAGGAAGGPTGRR
jgi:hypothetical protein